MDLLSICLIVVSCVMSGAAAYRLITSGRWPRVDGEITGHSGGSRWLDPYKHASFRFTTVDGITLDVASSDGATFAPAMGKKVRVAYDPQMPTNARIDSALGRGIWLFILGDALLLVAILRFVL